MPRPAVDMTGWKVGQWTVLARAQMEGTRHAYWHCACECGAVAVVRGSKLRAGESTRCVECQHVARRASEAEVGYQGVHLRLRRWRGSASDYLCRCGSPAAHWAYQYGDDAERDAQEGPYSPNLDAYAPMCRPCHKRFDVSMAKEMPACA